VFAPRRAWPRRAAEQGAASAEREEGAPAAAASRASEELGGQIERAAATIDEARRQIQHAIDQRLQEVGTERREVRSKLAETEERLRAAADVAVRREILAPEAGTVVNLRLFTLGAVVKPGDPVLDLVPEGDRLVAEVNVQPSDIDVVHPGLEAEVRLPAFKQRLLPMLHGRVTWVAADATANEQSRPPYYRAQILLDREALARHPGVHLVRGCRWRRRSSSGIAASSATSPSPSATASHARSRSSDAVRRPRADPVPDRRAGKRRARSIRPKETVECPRSTTTSASPSSGSSSSAGATSRRSAR
jgi:HlyD family secretion protein